MGFWHTGYMEFHEPTGEMSEVPSPPPPVFTCAQCGVEFSTDSDLRFHAFEGHAIRRPVLVFRGRECGRTRLIVTTPSVPSDWVFRSAEAVTVNDVALSADEASVFLSEQRRGVCDVVLTNAGVKQTFQFEFALSEEEDLHGVDRALDHLIAGGELGLRSIDDFIMRSRGYPTATRYMSGLANYLYGVLAREGAGESDRARRPGQAGYEGKYDQAVAILGGFDRHPAEAICGLVAFHYNQFPLAATKTRSRRVAEVSLRFRAILERDTWTTEDLSLAPHSSLDFALSDSVIEQVLHWSAVPLNGSAGQQVSEMVADLTLQRPADALKLGLTAAEHFLAVGDLSSAQRYADALRHGRVGESWYTDFRTRAQGATSR